MTILQNSDLSFLGKSYLNCTLFTHSDWQWLIIIPRGVNFIHTIHFVFTPESIVCYCKTLRSWWILYSGFLLSPRPVTALQKKKVWWVWNDSFWKKQCCLLLHWYHLRVLQMDSVRIQGAGLKWVHIYIFPFVCKTFPPLSSTFSKGCNCPRKHFPSLCLSHRNLVLEQNWIQRQITN